MTTLQSEPTLPEGWASADSDQRSTMLMLATLKIQAETRGVARQIETLIPIVNALNTRCKKLEAEVDDLKMILSCNSQSAELKISCIPLSVALPGTEIAKRLLSYVNLDSLHNSILSVRKVNYKDTAETQAFIVQLTSCQIRDFIVKTVKCHGEIFSDDIFPEFVKNHSKIFANEFFSQSTHVLLQKTKEKARVCNYKFTWAKNGVIYTRKDESSKTITIITTSDLDKVL